MLAITSIVHNRLWVLQHFLDGILNLDYPKSDTAIIFIDDGSDDGTLEALKRFKRDHGRKYAKFILDPRVAVPESQNSARESIDGYGNGGFQHLCDLRNAALQHCLDIGADYQLSIDSDILVSPGLVKGLMAHGVPYVATLIYNDVQHLGYAQVLQTPDPDGIVRSYHHGPNNGYIFPACEVTETCIRKCVGRNIHPAREWEHNALLPAGYSGACYLVDRSVLESGVRFTECKYGEDISYCYALQHRGIQPMCDTTRRAVHAMVANRLTESLSVFRLWFGHPVAGPVEEDVCDSPQDLSPTTPMPSADAATPTNPSNDSQTPSSQDTATG